MLSIITGDICFSRAFFAKRKMSNIISSEYAKKFHFGLCSHAEYKTFYHNKNNNNNLLLVLFFFSVRE